jgi:hypothetical protein
MHVMFAHALSRGFTERERARETARVYLE